MGRRSNTTGRQAMRVAERLGWSLTATRGDHFVYTKLGHDKVSIPRHRELKPGTLFGVIKASV